jgi:hypothetical protein
MVNSIVERKFSYDQLKDHHLSYQSSSGIFSEVFGGKPLPEGSSKLVKRKQAIQLTVERGASQRSDEKLVVNLIPLGQTE